MENSGFSIQSAAEATRRMGRFGLVLGICLAILGLMVVVRPDVPLLLLGVLIGIELLFLGVLRVVAGASGEGLSVMMRALIIIGGVLTGVAGLICLFGPGLPLTFLAVLLGVGWLIDGIANVIFTVRHSDRSSGLAQIIFAVCSILAGLVVIIWPGKSLLLMTQLVGIIFIALGVVAVVTAYPQLRAQKENIKTS